MAKILNIRERVHQPYRDALIRTAGLSPGTLGSNSDLFIAQGRSEGFTNLKTSAVLPNDSSMIVLAARVLQWFRRGTNRDLNLDGTVHLNGDFNAFPNDPAAPPAPAQGNAAGDYLDVYRLHWQCAEGLFWTLGAGDKDSLKSMPSMYFPYGGGLDAILGMAARLNLRLQEGEWYEPLIHFNNGESTHTAILRLARAITLTPRQLIKASVTAIAYGDGGNAPVFGSRTTTGRNMLDPIANLNAVDAIAKVISLTIDGLLSRDVQ